MTPTRQRADPSGYPMNRAGPTLRGRAAVPGAPRRSPRSRLGSTAEGAPVAVGVDPEQRRGEVDTLLARSAQPRRRAASTSAAHFSDAPGVVSIERRGSPGAGGQVATSPFV